jgi:heat shock protein HtpX
MKYIKPILAFIIVNISIIIWISLIFFILSLFWIHINLWNNLLLYSFIVWFWASIISLLVSKFIINWQYNIQKIESYPDIQDISRKYDLDENKIISLYEELKRLEKLKWYSNITLWIYEDEEPNAFAYWCWICWRNIAFSTAIIKLMNTKELLWVLWHEFTHINNWDVTTMTILQGFINTFVIYISRTLAAIVANWDDDKHWWILYFILSMIFEFLFGILASIVVAWYSRIREYKADEWSALLEWKDKMIAALGKLKLAEEKNLIWIDNREVATAFKIDSKSSLLHLFSTHPPLEDRIKHLENLNI